MKRTISTTLILTLLAVLTCASAQTALAQTSGVTKSSDVISIEGTASDDAVIVSEAGIGLVRVNFNGEDSFFVCPLTGAGAPTILFFGRAGDDSFVNQTELMTFALGGTGADILIATTGTALFNGEGGNDLIAGGR